MLRFELMNALTVNLFCSTSGLSAALLYLIYVRKRPIGTLIMEGASFLLSDLFSMELSAAIEELEKFW